MKKSDMLSSLQVSSKPTSRLRTFLVWTAAILFCWYQMIASSNMILGNKIYELNPFNVQQSALVISAFYYAYIILQIPCGILLDKFGPRVVMTTLCALSTVGILIYYIPLNTTLISNITLSTTILLIAKIIFGAGSACAFISCLKLASSWYRPSKFPFIVAIATIIGMLGNFFTFRFLMLVNAFEWHPEIILIGLGVAISTVCWVFIKDKPDNDISHHQSQKASCTSGIKNIVKSPQNWLIGLYGCIMFLITPIFFAECFAFLTQQLEKTTLQIIVAYIVPVLGIVAGYLSASYWSKILCSHKKVLSLSTTSAFAGIIVIAGMPEISLSVMVGMLCATGYFLSLSVICIALAKESNPIENTATTIGFINTIFVFVGLIAEGLLLNHTENYTQENYKFALSVALIGLFISRILVFFIRDTYTNSQEIQSEEVKHA